MLAGSSVASPYYLAGATARRPSKFPALFKVSFCSPPFIFRIYFRLNFILRPLDRFFSNYPQRPPAQTSRYLCLASRATQSAGTAPVLPVEGRSGPSPTGRCSDLFASLLSLAHPPPPSPTRVLRPSVMPAPISGPLPQEINQTPFARLCLALWPSPPFLALRIHPFFLPLPPLLPPLSLVFLCALSLYPFPARLLLRLTLLLPSPCYCCCFGFLSLSFLFLAVFLPLAFQSFIPSSLVTHSLCLKWLARSFFLLYPPYRLHSAYYSILDSSVLSLFVAFSLFLFLLLPIPLSFFSACFAIARPSKYP